jgi:diguanylate cyclase (GGDEF)-like protein
VASVRAAHRSRELLDLALRRNVDLENLAYYDELTALPNRRGSMRQLEVLLSRARRHGLSLAVMVIDADHFKNVNDNYGHAAGDAVLCALGQRLRKRVRSEDIVGRWGGEEFVVALPDTTAEGALALAEQLRRSIARRPLDIGERAVRLTISIGVAAHDGEESLTALLDRADRALYAAKAGGRDRATLDAQPAPAPGTSGPG